MTLLRRLVSGFVLAVLVLAAIAVAIYGALQLTVATLGVGAVALAIFIAVLARIAQAADHHADLREMIESRSREIP
jgi:hypothetical protein